MEKVELLLQRMDYTNNSTYGTLFNHKQEQLGFVIEDTYRMVKEDGVTRIPSGLYQIKYREVLSNMTKKYREKYDWFGDWHLELQNVPDFEYVYTHIGNRHTNSEGCLLLNNGVQRVGDEYKGLDSTSCFKDFYTYVCHLLDAGIEVWIRIRDEAYFKQPF